MTPPRLRRLHSDYQGLINAFSGHRHIKVEPMGPAPAEKYRVIYHVPGLVMKAGVGLQPMQPHVVEVQLSAAYPREKPYCICRSEIFHPNFGNYICIADYWSPSQSLVDVVVQIGDMLQYKLYNTKSPLNARAALWATQNVAQLPLSSLELLPLDPEVKLGRTRAAEVHDQVSLKPQEATETGSSGERHSEAISSHAVLASPPPPPPPLAAPVGAAVGALSAHGEAANE